MPFIWNDKTYWKRFKASGKSELKILLPLIIISFILYYLLLKDSVAIMLIAILSFFFGGSIYTFLSIFKEFPNSDIPDTYSSSSRKFIYIIQFAAAIIGFSLMALYIFNGKH